MLGLCAGNCTRSAVCSRGKGHGGFCSGQSVRTVAASRPAPSATPDSLDSAAAGSSGQPRLPTLQHPQGRSKAEESRLRREVMGQDREGPRHRGTGTSAALPHTPGGQLPASSQLKNERSSNSPETDEVGRSQLCKRITRHSRVCQCCLASPGLLETCVSCGSSHNHCLYWDQRVQTCPEEYRRLSCIEAFLCSRFCNCCVPTLQN